MKKLLILSIAAFGVMALSGCDLINKAKEVVTQEKEVKYEGFVDAFRNSTTALQYKKAIQTDKMTTPEQKKEYIFVASTHEWIYSEEMIIEGSTVNVEDKKFLEAYYFAMQLKENAEGKYDVDEKFKFINNTKEDTWKIVNAEKDGNNSYEVEFTSGGMMTSYKVTAETKYDGVITVSYVYKYSSSDIV